MTTEQETRLNNAKNQVVTLVEMAETCDTRFQLDRRRLFAIDKAVTSIIEAMEDELVYLEAEMSTDEYTTWQVVIDSLRKL